MIALVGPTAAACAALESRYPGLNVVFHTPPMGFITSEREVQKCVDFVVRDTSSPNFSGSRNATARDSSPSALLITRRPGIGSCYRRLDRLSHRKTTPRAGLGSKGWLGMAAPSSVGSTAACFALFD